MDNLYIGKNLKRIRLGKKLSQKNVAQMAGVSLSGYSNIESGKTVPKMDTIYKIAGALDVNIQHFISPVKELNSIRLRAQKRLRNREQIKYDISNWLESFNYLIALLDQEIDYSLDPLPRRIKQLKSSKPIKAAELVREKMGLDQKEPIHDITGLLAANGIKVLAYPVESDAFFGMSVAKEDGGPAIVVNVWDRIPVERWIFSAAHELGHLMLHLSAFDASLIEEDDKEEKEANLFASHFLMPHEGFFNEWEETYGLSFIDRVFKVKRIFHVSYKTIIYRLIESGNAEPSIWSRLQFLLKCRYRRKISSKVEPEPLHRYDFITDWLERLVRIAIEEAVISLNRGSEILNIPLTEMRTRINSGMPGGSGIAEEKVYR